MQAAQNAERSVCMKKAARTAAVVMLAAAVVFLAFALTHPEASWPWGNGVSYTLYAAYLAVMAALFFVSTGRPKK